MVIFAKKKILKIDRKPMTNSVSYFLRIIEDKSLMIGTISNQFQSFNLGLFSATNTGEGRSTLSTVES